MPETPDGGWILDDSDNAGPYGRPTPEEAPGKGPKKSPGKGPKKSPRPEGEKPDSK